jgi:hypothetical protein
MSNLYTPFDIIEEGNLTPMETDRPTSVKEKRKKKSTITHE